MCRSRVRTSAVRRTPRCAPPTGDLNSRCPDQTRSPSGPEFETIAAVTPRPTERDLHELREKRLAANEVFFRELNEKLERQTDDSDTLVVVCECADGDCAQRLTLTRREYEAARSQPVLFVVAHGHVDPEIEEVISRTERYELVRKIGVGREVATRLESTSEDKGAPLSDGQ